MSVEKSTRFDNGKRNLAVKQDQFTKDLKALLDEIVYSDLRAEQIGEVIINSGLSFYLPLPAHAPNHGAFDNFGASPAQQVATRFLMQREARGQKNVAAIA
jgi:hypothetical protein